jgi:hypothetical protein
MIELGQLARLIYRSYIQRVKGSLPHSIYVYDRERARGHVYMYP